MKRFIALWSLFGLLLACILVGYATVRQAGANTSLDGLLAAQSRTPALLALDAAALYILVSCALFTFQQRHVVFGVGEVHRLREEHQTQLEAMLTNTAKLEQTNADQADHLTEQEAEIVAQQERIQGLTAQTASLRAEIDARQEAFEVEARRLTEQAFRALSGQVDANARQLDAVNLALSYHRSELQLLRRSQREIDSGSETEQVARLSPTELTAIAAPDLDGALVHSNENAEPAALPVTAVVSVSTLNAPSTVIQQTLHFGVFPKVDTPTVEAVDPNPDDPSGSTEVSTLVSQEESMFLLAPMPEHSDLPSSLPISSNHLNTPQDHSDPLPPPLVSAPNVPAPNQSLTDTPAPNAPPTPIAPTGWQRKL
jgi:hypothetical protein